MATVNIVGNGVEIRSIDFPRTVGHNNRESALVEIRNTTGGVPVDDPDRCFATLDALAVEAIVSVNGAKLYDEGKCVMSGAGWEVFDLELPMASIPEGVHTLRFDFELANSLQSIGSASLEFEKTSGGTGGHPLDDVITDGENEIVVRPE